MVELLAPAGDLEKLRYAYHYGADACYIGGLEYSLRARASNFSAADIKEACALKNSYGKKLYVTLNIIPHNENLEGLVDYLHMLEEAGVDGVIVASPYIMKMAKKHTKMEVHISTQQSVVSSYSIDFFKSLGANRIVLGRELTLSEIKEIKNSTNLDLEVFIHGGMCASYSGRCTLSNTFTLRDANRGGCAHSCRWSYDLYDNGIKINEEIPFKMGSKDLEAVKEITTLIDIGINSLKIEGRMKSIHYLATIINTYRMLIDEYKETGKIEDYDYYQTEIKKAENRVTAQGFLRGMPTKDSQIYDSSEVPNKAFVGIIKKCGEYTLIEQRNYFRVGDTLEVFSPSKKVKRFKVEEILNENKEPVDAARHPQEMLYLKIPFEVKEYDLLRLI
ncbi:MAG: peptidase U32 family protein [Acholeplasmatales bacterium]